MKTITINGKEYKIMRSERKNKKYKVKVGDKVIHFGAKGYRIFPSTKRGDLYCARSYGIMKKEDINSSNFWSRKLWRCKGKKSMR